MTRREVRDKADKLISERNKETEEVRKKADAEIKRAEDMKKIAEYAKRVIELPAFEKNVDENNVVLTILFNPKDNGWVLMYDGWTTQATLSGCFTFRDADKVFELIKADFAKVGLGIYDEKIYDDTLIVFRAYIQKD